MKNAVMYPVGTIFYNDYYDRDIVGRKWFRVMGYTREGKMEVLNFAKEFGYSIPLEQMKTHGIPIKEYCSCHEKHVISNVSGDYWSGGYQVHLKHEFVFAVNFD